MTYRPLEYLEQIVPGDEAWDGREWHPIWCRWNCVRWEPKFGPVRRKVVSGCK
jgi:hypothetical protein